MHTPLSKTECVVTVVGDDAAFRNFSESGASGISFVAESIGNKGALGIKADFVDFGKWLATEHPDLAVGMPSAIPKIVLRGADIWLPLVYLSDVSVQIFLKMVAAYLYERAKGALKGDRPRVDFSVVYLDKRAGKTKRFKFSGDADTLGKAIKRFDLDNFFDEKPED